VNHFKRYWLEFLFLLSAAVGVAQDQIGFRQLSIAHGLSQNCGISIAQDSTGFLWIATQDGLNRYDGSQFVKYPFIFSDITRPSYSHLGKVYVDRKGALWAIPVSRILQRFDREAGTFESFPLLSDTSTLYHDSNQRFWAGTFQDGIPYFSFSEGRLVPEGRVDIPATVYALAEAGELLLAATDNGVWEIGRETAQVTAQLDRDDKGQKLQNGISSVAIEAGGRQWFGTFGSGLFYRDAEASSLTPASELSLSSEIPSDLNILSLFIDSKNRLWAGTYGSGLYLLDLTSLQIRHFSPDKHNPRAIHYNDILSICEDYTGTLWFGTDGAGISYYDEYLEKFNSITNNQVPEDIHVDVVRALQRDTMGNIWIGTSGKGLMRYHIESNSWTKFSAGGPPGSRLPSDRVMSLYHDGDELWVGTQGGGLSILDGKGGITNFIGNPDYGLEAITIWDILRDRKGRTWLATRQFGLLQFHRERGLLSTFNAAVSKDMPVFNNVRAIAEGDNGVLWLAGDTDGLIRLNPDTGAFRHYRAGDSENDLPNNKLKSLYFAPDGLLWIGTNGSGLTVLDPPSETFRTYTEQDGLANNVIYGILPDGSGNLWLSSNRGITRFTPSRDASGEPDIANYTNYEGLATEFNTGASYRHQDGTLYFGGLEGFYWFSPENIKENPHLPKTAITGMLVANETYPMEAGASLNHQQHTVSFTFSSLQFSLPGENEYRYRLLNYDEDWIPAGHSNFARYSFLPPGAYEFKVQSSNYDGLWNPEPAVYSFSITPPWYNTAWARGMYILTGLLLIWGAYAYFRSRWRMKLNLTLKEAEANRLQRLNAFKSKLYTDISHEIRTPLSLIAAPVEAKLKEGGLSDDAYTRYSMINRNAKRILSLVDQMLHLARLEKGKLSLKPEPGDLALFLRVLVRAFEYRAEQAKVSLQWNVADMPMVWYDADILDKIATNLLTNAIKYCSQEGSCNFEAFLEEKQLHIRVSNTVRNPEKIDTKKMFSRFYQGNDLSEGAGVGLALVKELVSLYKGNIEVSLAAGQIHFSVDLPVRILAAEDAINPSGDRAKRKKDILEAEREPERPLVLIVEDHREVREYLQDAWEGTYRVRTAADGAAGLEEAITYVPDLVLTDIRMPQLSGIELCNRLKTDERTSHIPVILFTSSSGVEQELRGLESGADDFVTKPFKLAVLEKRIENLIRIRRSLRDRYSQQYILEAREIAITPTDEAFLNKVQGILDAHLSDAAFTAETFARKVGMSRMQLHRKLQAYTGLSTTAFIRSQRLKQAAELLKTSDLSVNEVAYTVGFNTPSYFIKCFREAYGSTPAAFA
jgi:ligand-binding sensor domain-containing protein/signal transduction histidine kinase/DNA-binding response OmpR family regulator